MTVLDLRSRDAGARMSVVSGPDRPQACPRQRASVRTLPEPARPAAVLRSRSCSRCSWRSRLPGLVAGRLRLPRHAVGARTRPAGRDSDLPGADPRRRSRWGTRRSIRRCSSSRPCLLRCCRQQRPPGSGSSSCSAAVLASMWILEVRDWRCLGSRPPPRSWCTALWYGNLTVLLVLPLALAWRYRDRAPARRHRGGCGRRREAVRLAPVVWLLLTRRFRAAAWAAGIGGRARARARGPCSGSRACATTRRCSARVQDVYALRSLSLSTVAGALGASVSAAVAVAALVGLACPRARGVARPPTGRRPARVRGRRSGLHPLLAHRLAELRRPPVRPDRDHVAEARPGVVLRVRRVARRSTGPRSRSDAYSASTPRCRRAGLALEPHVACGMGSRCDVLGRRCGRPDRRILSPSSLGISNIRPSSDGSL